MNGTLVEAVLEFWKRYPAPNRMDLLLLLLLAGACDEHGVVKTTITCISERTRLSKKRVTAAIHNLGCNGGIHFRKDGNNIRLVLILGTQRSKAELHG